MYFSIQCNPQELLLGLGQPYSLSWKDKFSNLKSHDYNNLIHFMLPIAIHGFVTEGVHQAMFRLARFFCWVCSKNVDVRDLDFMKTESTIVMSLLEM
jgi:hypothetical protein